MGARPEQNAIGVGLVGYGFGGTTFHAPFISTVEGLELRAIVERSTDHARIGYPAARQFRSDADLLIDPSIDLVVITTPNTTHFEIARSALRAGKHVVIDKPITVTSRQAAELQAIAERNKLVLSPFHNRRWDGDFRTIARLIGEGTLGKLKQFESYFDRFRPELKLNAWRERPEPGSGLLYDLGPHLLDQAFALFGPPLSISADIRHEREQSITDDAFDLTLIYPKMEVRLGASMLRPSPRPRFVLSGTDGKFTKEGFDPQEAALKRGERPSGDSWGTERPESWGELQHSSQHAITRVPTERGDYRQYFENVRDAIRGLGPLAVTPAHGVQVIRAIETAMESHKAHGSIQWTT